MNNQLETKEQYSECLHDVLKYLGDHYGRDELAITHDELAVACGVPVESFVAHFPSINDLLQNIIHRMYTLFERQVQNQIVTCTFMKKKKVTYFLRCIRGFLEKTPEAGYLFTLGFFGDVMVDPVYPQLEQYYSLWEETLMLCISSVVSEQQAKSIARNYLNLLRGRCHRADHETISDASRDAERFLLTTLKYC